MTEILIAKKDKRDPRLRVKVTDRRVNGWAPARYEKIIQNKGYNELAYLLHDLHAMGYPIERAFNEFKKLINDPELFFLK